MSNSLVDIFSAIKQEHFGDTSDAASPQFGQLPQQNGAAHQFPMMSPMPALQLGGGSDFVAQTPSLGLVDGDYWNAGGWQGMPVLPPPLVDDNLATAASAATSFAPYGLAMGHGAGTCYWLPLPVMPSFHPMLLSQSPTAQETALTLPVAGMAYDNAPPTPPPSTSRYQETAMESSIRAMWRASTYLPYDREEVLGHLARQPSLIGQPQPASLDDAISVLWRARGGVSPFPYDALVQDFVVSAGAPTQTAAAVAQQDLPLEAAIPLLRRESPVRPACRLGNARRTSLPGPRAAAGPTGWASDYFGVRARRIERQGAIRAKAAKRLAAEKEAEGRQAAKKLAARDARNQKRSKKQ